MIRSLVAVALVGCTPKPPAAVEAPAADAAPALSDPLPFRSDIRHGTFDNGVQWYVVKNPEPEARAELRLVVDAGSILEDEDQLGLAHFVEHMAFNGTEHFEGNELVKYLERIGTRFGAHLNASTGFDTTTYMLRVPTDDPELLRNGMLVLGDWADGVTFADEEIEKERGVVLEEWRTRLGAGGRISEALIPYTFHGSHYVDRLPIGTEDSLTGFDPDALRRFYDTWYRPELMAVIAVGDFDVDVGGGLLEDHAADLPPTAVAAPERTRHELPAHETQVAIVTDPEVPQTSIQMMSKYPGGPAQTWGDYREDHAVALATAILNERLATLSREADAPFLGAGGGVSGFVPGTQMDVLGAQIKQGKELDAVRALWTEVRRAQEFGFTDAEIARAKAARLRQFETMRDGEKTRDSRSIASELVRHVTTNESVPGTQTEYEAAARFIPELSDADLAAAAAKWMHQGSLVVALVMPESEDAPPPTAEQVLGVLAEVDQAELAPPADEALDGPLVETAPTPGTVTDKAPIPGTDAELWTLSNGIRVVSMPTDFDAGRVSFRAFSPGGHATVAADDFVPAVTAVSLVRRSGLGAWDAASLGKRLAGTSASANVYFGNYYAGFNGSAAKDDLETALQLVYLEATAPRFDDTGLALERENRAANLKNRLVSPEARWDDAYTAAMWPDAPRHAPWTVDTLEQLDLQRSAELYAARFADLSDMTFVFVGDYDPADLEALAATWLASLPGGDRDAEVGDTGERRADGVQSVEVVAGTDAKARYRLTFHGEFGGTPGEGSRLAALENILAVLLREELREERGGVYGVSVNGSWSLVPEPGYTFDISFQCDPERVGELRDATFATIQALAKGPLDADYLASEQEKARRQHELNLRSNGWWAGTFERAYRDGYAPEELVGSHLAALEALTTDQVVADAAAWLDTGRYVEATLLPAAAPE